MRYESEDHKHGRTSHYMTKRTYEYTGVDGRTYVVEREPRPCSLKPFISSDKYISSRHQEKISATAIAHIEELLSILDRLQENGKVLSCGEIKGTITVQRRTEIVEKYSLRYNSTSRLYEGDSESIIRILQTEHPSCRQFKNLKELHYAARFGYSPVRTVPLNENTPAQNVIPIK